MQLKSMRLKRTPSLCLLALASLPSPGRLSSPNRLGYALGTLAQDHNQHETAAEFYELALKADSSKGAEALLAWSIDLLVDDSVDAYEKDKQTEKAKEISDKSTKIILRTRLTESKEERRERWHLITQAMI